MQKRQLINKTNRVENKLTTIKYRHVVIIVIIQDLTSPTLKTLTILYLPLSLPDSLSHSLPPLTHLIIGFSETTMPAPLLINWSSCILNFCFKIYNLKATKWIYLFFLVYDTHIFGIIIFITFIKV